MTPQKYLELGSALLVAKAEEYFGIEWARYQFELASSTNFVGREFVESWVVTDGHPYYPLPPDGIPNSGSDFWVGFTFFDVHAAPIQTTGGGVITLTDDLILRATQVQTLSDGSQYSIDFEADSKTIEQLSPAAQAALAPAGGDL